MCYDTLIIENADEVSEDVKEFSRLYEKFGGIVTEATNAMTRADLPELIKRHSNIVIKSAFYSGEKERHQLETLVDAFYNRAFDDPDTDYQLTRHIYVFDAVHYMNKWTPKHGSFNARVGFSDYDKFMRQLIELVNGRGNHFHVHDIYPDYMIAAKGTKNPATQWDKENGNWEQIKIMTTPYVGYSTTRREFFHHSPDTKGLR